MNIDMTMFHQAFFDEATDLLADFETLLLRLEETPDDHELLQSIFRCAHSLKGGSATFGFTDIAHFTHGLETLLDQVRNGKAIITHIVAQILFESLDQLKALLAVARGEASSAPDATVLIQRIEAAIASPTAPSKTPSVANAAPSDDDPDGCWGIWTTPRQWHLRVAPGPDTLRTGLDPLRLIRELHEAGDCEIQCDLSDLPSLTELDPAQCYLSWEIDLRSDWEHDRILEIFDFIADDSEITLTEMLETREEVTAPTTEIVSVAPIAAVAAPEAPKAKTPPSASPAETARPQAANAETQTLRVSTDKVDKLINLVGELIINQSMLNEVVSNFSMQKLPRLIEAVAQMERASRELQERVMAVRMLPIKHAFGRFPRLVRDLAAACGKKIELKTTGEETELDKTVIEAIGDPLTHLVRNSVDHGLETPEDRVAAGKPELGTVSINAFHEGGNIVIEVSDDGKGLDKDRIYRKAIERGLISETDPVPTDDALYNFIFHAGFSTAKAVTDLSGRGVGMDIVKQSVQALGGSISLTSTPGQGTRFRVRLPLTMAILEGLSLAVGPEVYVLPLTSIVESIRPKAGDVRVIAGAGEVAMVRGEVLPIIRLYEIFGSEPGVTDPTQGLLVIVENDGHKIAVLVDELIGQSQVVIKSIETNYRKVDGIAGATIMGDGRVALIMDVPGLIRSACGGETMRWAA